MSKLIDKNIDEEGKLIFRFSEATTLKKGKNNFEPNSESFALRELEYLKIRALAQRFELENDDPNMWLHLALKLAQLLYPEKIIKAKAGRKLKWTDEIRLILYLEVKKLVVRGDKAKGISYACNVLSKNEPWISLLSKDADKKHALRAQYYEAKELKKRMGN